MRYANYLRWEGACSIVLGVALAAVALAFGSSRAWWAGLLFVPATLVALGAYARARRGVPLLAAGRWLTERPIREAAGDGPGIDPRLRLVVETAIWIVAVGAWVIASGDSGLLVFGTGLASAAFGAVQAGPAARRAERDAPEARIVRRPGLGTPDLVRGAASPRTS